MKRLVVAIGVLTALSEGLAAVGHFARFCVNTTASVPVGLWRVRDRIPERGAVAVFCPPDVPAFRAARRAGYVPRGWCPGGFERVLKPVAALPGDRVHVGPDGISVNEVLLPHTRPLALPGPALQPYPQGSYAVAPGQVWVLSSYNARSWDSRYFGPIPLAAVSGVASPVWVWGRL